MFATLISEDKTNVYYEVYLSREYEAKYLRILTISGLDNAQLDDVLYDPGDGWCPFNPLVLSISGLAETLPMSLVSGRDYVFQFRGQPFKGIGLRLTGYNMWTVESIDLLKRCSPASNDLAPAEGPPTLLGGGINN